MIRDREATQSQHYEDKRSYMCFDGREVLYGKDWDARKYVVWCNAGGRCEQKMFKLDNPRNFERCRESIAHVHHKIKRSEKRDDRLENLEGLCPLHHRLRHPEKQTQWTKREIVKDPVTQETLIRYSKGKQSVEL